MSSDHPRTPTLLGPVPPLLLASAGVVLMALPIAMEKELGIPPASLSGWTKFCVMVATFAGLTMFVRGASVLLAKPGTGDQTGGGA